MHEGVYCVQSYQQNAQKAKTMKNSHRNAAIVGVAAFVTGVFVWPQFTFAATTPSAATRMIGSSMQSAVQFLSKAPSKPVTASKQYTDNTNGFRVTMPAGWTKGTPTDDQILFVATKGTTNIWELSSYTFTTKQEASDTQKYLTSHPRTFAKSVLDVLNASYGTCTTASAKKRTIGSRTGGEGVFHCTIAGKKYTVSYFSFVKSLTQYTTIAFAKKSQFAALQTQFDTMTKSVSFFTPTAASTSANLGQLLGTLLHSR